MRRLLILLMVAIVFLMIAVPLDFFELSHSDVNTVCFGKDCFEVELAVTPAEKMKGLMDREFLGQDHGMLFIFDTMGTRGFWMKDVLIRLDMIFIDCNNQVVYIKKNASPCVKNCPVIIPDRDYIYVLEINGGVSEEISIREGDSVIMRTIE